MLLQQVPVASQHTVAAAPKLDVNPLDVKEPKGQGNAKAEAPAEEDNATAMEREASEPAKSKFPVFLKTPLTTAPDIAKGYANSNRAVKKTAVQLGQ